MRYGNCPACGTQQPLHPHGLLKRHLTTRPERATIRIVECNGTSRRPREHSPLGGAA